MKSNRQYTQMVLVGAETMQVESQSSEIEQQGWTIQTDVGPYIEMIGPLWSRWHEGQRQYAVRIERKHLNTNGVVHGGMLVSVIDQVVSHVIGDQGEKVPMATIDLDSQFIEAVKEGDWLVASGHIYRRTRSLVFMRGELCVGERVCLAAQVIMKLRTT